MIAIILAAGCGRRLQIKKPKGMLNIGCQPLIKYSIDSLEKCGITKLVIVTGFATEQYEMYLKNLKTKVEIETVQNLNFSDSGSLYSLYLALSIIRKKSIMDDIIILDSDIIFNIDEFMDFVNNSATDAIMTTNVIEGRYDACYVSMDSNEQLIKISKNINYISRHEDIYWEHIGIVKSSKESIINILDYSECMSNSNRSWNYEYDYVFENIKRKYKIIKYRDYIWSEVDDNFQLNYMITNVYPKLNLTY